MRNLIEWLFSILIGVVLVLLFYLFVGTRYQVSGESMMPTFHNADNLFVSKINKSLDLIDRGDVVVFHADGGKDYIKRVIGKEGDKVLYKDDILYINGKKIKESYLDENKKANSEINGDKLLTEDFSVDTLKDTDSEVIPKDKILVLGDNRANSLDSRYIGLVDRDKVVGEVVLRFGFKDKFKYGFKGFKY